MSGPGAGKPVRGHWRPADLDRLERAIVEGTRVMITRRGTEYVLVPREIRSRGTDEALIGTTVIGDDLEFALGEIDRFVVLD
jgi:hypothetical protein